MAAARGDHAPDSDADVAVLLAGEAGPLPRTHSGLLSLFGARLVVTGILPKDMGRALERVEEIRLVADYTDDAVEAEIARQIVEQAETFVAGIAEFVGSVAKLT